MEKYIIGGIQDTFYYILNLSIICSILAIVILILRKIFDKKISPKWKFAMWALLIISLIFPIKIVIQSNNNYQYDLNQYLKDIIKAIEIDALGEYMPLIIFIWFLVLIFILSIFIINTIKMKIKIGKKELADKRIIRIFEESKKILNINNNIKLIEQDYKKVPCIYGIIHPKILVTDDIFLKDDETIKYIFMHELAHFKRKDLILNKLLILLLSFYWFNPIIWICFKQIRQDMELKADEMVLEHIGKEKSKEYAKTLVSLLPLTIEEKYTTKVLYVTDGKKNMERRIKMIKLSEKFKEYKSLIGVTTILLTLCIGMLIFTQIKPVEETVINTVQYFETPDRIVYKQKDRDWYYVFNQDENGYINIKNQLIRCIEGLGEGEIITQQELAKLENTENYIELDYDTISKNYLIFYEKDNMNVLKRTDDGAILVRNNIKQKENLEKIIEEETSDKKIYQMSDNKEYKTSTLAKKDIVENDAKLKKYEEGIYGIKVQDCETLNEMISKYNIQISEAIPQEKFEVADIIIIFSKWDVGSIDTRVGGLTYNFIGKEKENQYAINIFAASKAINTNCIYRNIGGGFYEK